MFPFMDTFQNVRRVFPLRGDDHEIRQVGASYFKAMRRYPLSAVQAGAEVWLQRGKRFPRPAEWIESIPPLTPRPELLVLTADQVALYRRAEMLQWEDAPCGCVACQEANVTDKPLRFVPEVNADGTDAKALLGDRVIVTGHWAHGAELARWYTAKQAFWAAMFDRFGADSPRQQRRVRKSFEDRMKEIFEEGPRLRAQQQAAMEPLTPQGKETTRADEQPDDKRGSTDAGGRTA